MPEEVKFTEKELKQVNEIQENYLDIQSRFGQISVARIRLEEQIMNMDKNDQELRNNFGELQKKEKDFLDGITKKYGEGSLNPDTGIFTPNKSN